jgi:hypothetical protein
MTSLRKDLWHCLDRVAYAEYLGTRLHRRKLIPDEWQQDFLRDETKLKILKASRQVGKSTVIAAVSLHKAHFDAGSLTILFAPTEKQAKELFAKVARYHIAYGGEITAENYRRMSVRGGDVAALRAMGVAFPNGSRIEAMAATDNSSRGFSPDLLVIDEAAYAEDSFYDAILPSLVVSKGELILASTPNGKRGFFYEEWVSGGESWSRYEIPWWRCPRIDGEYVERQRRRRGDRHARQEYECSFEETIDSVFSREQVMRSHERGKKHAPLFTAEDEEMLENMPDPLF